MTRTATPAELETWARDGEDDPLLPSLLSWDERVWRLRMMRQIYEDAGEVEKVEVTTRKLAEYGCRP